MIARFDSFGMTFQVEFFSDEAKKLWIVSCGDTVPLTWDFVDSLRDRRYNPITKITQYEGSPRYQFDTAMEDAMQEEMARYKGDDE